MPHVQALGVPRVHQRASTAAQLEKEEDEGVRLVRREHGGDARRHRQHDADPRRAGGRLGRRIKSSARHRSRCLIDIDIGVTSAYAAASCPAHTNIIPY